MQRHDEVIRAAAEGVMAIRSIIPEYGAGARPTTRSRILRAARALRLEILRNTMHSDALAMLLPAGSCTGLLLSRRISPDAAAVALRMATFQAVRDAEDLPVLLPATSPPHPAALAAFIDLIPRSHAQHATRVVAYEKSLIQEIQRYTFVERRASPVEYARVIVRMRMECWLRYDV